MYYPYLRGKQFELLALKEMAQDESLSQLVHPVIEPVRDIDGGGLERCILELHKRGLPSTIIVNPQVGHLAGEPDSTRDMVTFLNDRPYLFAYINLGILVTSGMPIGQILSDLNSLSVANSAVSLLHRDFPDDASDLFKIFDKHTVVAQFVDSQDATRRYRTLSDYAEYRNDWGAVPLVKWQDHFPKQLRNIDYVDMPEQLFSDDHLYFEEDGFAGISDFQTIGDGYQDGGRLPRAVVLHLTYQRESSGPIYIRHFASDSNLDAADTAGKFSEAVAKLVRFADERELENPAVEKFRFYESTGGFPGLGTLKKVSIQNHIYVMQKALEQK